jgi:hypothetical protein
MTHGIVKQSSNVTLVRLVYWYALVTNTFASTSINARAAKEGQALRNRTLCAAAAALALLLVLSPLAVAAASVVSSTWPTGLEEEAVL